MYQDINFIIDTEKCTIERRYDDICKARYALNDSYAWEAHKRYQLMHSEDELYEYWYEYMEESGVLYEGTGISENRLHDMFNEWKE